MNIIQICIVLVSFASLNKYPSTHNLDLGSDPEPISHRWVHVSSSSVIVTSFPIFHIWSHSVPSLTILPLPQKLVVPPQRLLPSPESRRGIRTPQVLGSSGIFFSSHICFHLSFVLFCSILKEGVEVWLSCTQSLPCPGILFNLSTGWNELITRTYIIPFFLASPVVTDSLSQQQHWLDWCHPGEWWYLLKTLLMSLKLMKMMKMMKKMKKMKLSSDGSYPVIKW